MSKTIYSTTDTTLWWKNTEKDFCWENDCNEKAILRVKEYLNDMSDLWIMSYWCKKHSKGKDMGDSDQNNLSNQENE